MGQTEQFLLSSNQGQIERKEIGVRPRQSNRVLTVYVVIWEDQTEGRDRTIGVALWLRSHEVNDLLVLAQQTSLSEGSLFNSSLVNSRLWTLGQILTIKTQDSVNRVLTKYVERLDYTDHELVKLGFLSLVFLRQLKTNLRISIQMPSTSGRDEVRRPSHRRLLLLAAHIHKINPYQSGPVGNRESFGLGASAGRDDIQEAASAAIM